MGQSIKSVCTIGDLKKLEVINLCDGGRMGYICDVEFDLYQGCICAILLPKKTEIGELFRKDCRRFHRIPWCKIERIGEDTILVHYSEVKA